MTRSMIGKGVVLALVLTLLGICIVDVVHAAMPSEAPMDCAMRFCNGPSGCEPTSAIVLHALTPLATVPSTVTVAAPSTAVTIVSVAQPSPVTKQHVRSSAPRSPPLV